MSQCLQSPCFFEEGGLYSELSRRVRMHTLCRVFLPRRLVTWGRGSQGHLQPSVALGPQVSISFREEHVGKLKTIIKQLWAFLLPYLPYTHLSTHNALGSLSSARLPFLAAYLKRANERPGLCLSPLCFPLFLWSVLYKSSQKVSGEKTLLSRTQFSPILEEVATA